MWFTEDVDGVNIDKSTCVHSDTMIMLVSGCEVGARWRENVMGWGETEWEGGT